MKTNSIITLLVSSVILTGVSAAITHYAIRDSRNRVEWVFHTYEVIDQAAILLKRLRDVESDQRSYLITGDSSYFLNLQRSRVQLSETADTISILVTDNPQQAALLNTKLIPAIMRKLYQVDAAINQYNLYGRDSAFARIKGGIGKALMDSIQLYEATFSNREKVLLANRLKEVNVTHNRQIVIRYGSFILIAFVSVLALFTIVQKQERNDHLIKELNLVNTSLEKKVEQRTVELKRQTDVAEELNQKLQENMEELEMFYETLQVKSIKTESALQEIEDLYNNAPCGYHSLASDGTIIRMNQTELKWLGYTVDEVLGKMHVTSILLPEEHTSYYNDFEAFKREGFIHNKEHTFLRKDGSTFPVLLNATAIYNELGEYTMSRGTVIDITERKAYERQLMEVNKKLTRFNTDKDNFLNVAAHDLKSPVNNILGLISLINMQKGNISPEQGEYILHIQHLCSNMQNLIGNLLDIGKIEGGIMVLTREPVNVSEFMKEHLDDFKEHAATKHISLILEDHTPNSCVITDRSALQRISENLISNALKFSPPHTRVIIRLEQTDHHLKMEIQDHGLGIHPDEINLLFRKFQKLSTRPTGGEGSSGLGLSIVKELVTALNGKIYVSSEVNKGTTFSVELPLSESA
jgi:PAS domain S-box-containing protein